MLIEYKIKFEKDGLTIAQHIEPNSTPVAYAGAQKAQVNGLPEKLQDAKATANPLATLGAEGGAPIGQLGGAPIGGLGGAPIGGIGGGAPASAPIFILGPIVFGNTAPPEVAKPVEPLLADERKALGAVSGN
jgi:hypothetical protein